MSLHSDTKGICKKSIAQYEQISRANQLVLRTSHSHHIRWEDLYLKLILIWSFLPTECPLVAEVQYVHSWSTPLRLVSFFVRLPKHSEQEHVDGSPQKCSPDLKQNTNTDTPIRLNSPSLIHSHTSSSGSLSLPMLLEFCPLILIFISCFLQSCLAMTIPDLLNTTSHHRCIFSKFPIPFFSKATFDCTVIIQLHNTLAEQLLCPSFLY